MSSTNVLLMLMSSTCTTNNYFYFFQSDPHAVTNNESAFTGSFSLAWLLAFTKSFACLVCYVAGLFTPLEKRGENKPTMWQKRQNLCLQRNTLKGQSDNDATTSCKNVETPPRKSNLSCFKWLPVTGLWDKIVTPLLLPFQSCSSKFWAWSCTASNFEKGWRGDHKHKIMDRLIKPKYGPVSQVLLQLVVASPRFSSDLVNLCTNAIQINISPRHF